MEEAYSEMKILNLEPFGYSERAKQKFVDSGWEYVASGWAEVLDHKHRDADALIVRLSRKVAGDDLDKFPDLKYILSATTGLDHIDLCRLYERHIRLISLRGEDDFLQTIPSTAEHTWALILSLMRNIPDAVSDVMRGSWNRDAFRGYQMKNKRIGIIGLGRTGRKVALYAKVFGMEVCFFDPYVVSNEYLKFEKLEDLLAASDIITLHVHLNQETRSLLNATNIKSIKRGAALINTSRGGIWDEISVTNALDDGIVGGVATDVLATELEDIKASALWRAMEDGKRVIITPHIGGATWDAMWACEEFIVDKFLAIQG